MQDATLQPSVISPPRQWMIDILILTGVFAAILLLFNYIRPLARPDAYTLIEIAREMLLNHNWATPTLNGVIQLNQPPLFYWLTALGLKLFGPTLFALRFWPGVFAILGLIMLYCFGHWYSGRRMGWICAATTGSSMLFLACADAASPYVIGTVLFAASICTVFITSFTKTAAHRAWLVLGFWVLCALNTLLIGVAGVLLPIVIGALFCYTLQLPAIFKSLFLSVRGIVAFLVIALPWYYVAEKHNPGFLHFYFITEQWVHYFDHFRNPLQSLLILVFGGIAALLPWSLLLNLGYRAVRPSAWEERFSKPLGVLILIWVITMVIYLIGISSRNLFWLCAIIPALSLAFSKTINASWDNINPDALKQDRDFLVILFFIFTAVFALLSGKTFQIVSDLTPTTDTDRLFWGLYALFLIGTVCCYITLRCTRLKYAAYVFTVTGVVWTISLLSALPVLRHETMQPIISYIETHQQPTDVIAAYEEYYPELGFRLHTTTVMLDWAHAPTFGAQHQNISGWVVSAPSFWQTIGQNHRKVWLVVPARSLPELQPMINEQKLTAVVTTPQAVLLVK